MRFLSRITAPLLFALLALAALSTCGISDEKYIDPVSPSNITRNFDISCSINNLENIEGDRFTLYYKIYISNANVSSTINPENMSTVNSTLLSDYNAILPYTPLNTSTNIQVFSMSVFSGRSFYPILIDGTHESFSDSAQFSVTLDFSSGKAPAFIKGGLEDREPLWRSNGGGSFKPLPEDKPREFFNYQEINNSQNRDVVSNSAFSGSGQYAYCAIYIIKTDINTDTLAAIYSAPTFVSVLRLPDPIN